MATTPTTARSAARPTGTLSAWEGMARQYDYWLTVYKRTWRGGVVGSFATPLFYVVAMGVLLGGFIDGDPDRLEGATSYLAFVVPGLVAAHEMTIAVSVGAVAPGEPDYDSFAWQVLTTLATSAEVEVESGRFTVTMTMSSSAVAT